MTQQNKGKKNIRYTQIPLAIEMSSVLGILNFSSEKNSTILQKPEIKVEKHNQEITYKNALGRISDSQNSEEQIVRKKVIPMNRITIRPQNIKKKYFRVDIPINKSVSAGVRNYKQKMNFVIQFGHDNRGTLTVVEDVYDCQMQITNAEKQLSFQEKLKLQDAKLDSRRRQEKVQILEQKKDGRKKQK